MRTASALQSPPRPCSTSLSLYISTCFSVGSLLSTSLPLWLCHSPCLPLYLSASYIPRHVACALYLEEGKPVLPSIRSTRSPLLTRVSLQQFVGGGNHRGNRRRHRPPPALGSLRLVTRLREREGSSTDALQHCSRGQVTVARCRRRRQQSCGVCCECACEPMGDVHRCTLGARWSPDKFYIYTHWMARLIYTPSAAGSVTRRHVVALV